MKNFAQSETVPGAKFKEKWSFIIISIFNSLPKLSMPYAEGKISIYIWM